ncbi:unnamed protein product, partial [Nesidiocoris tenuis]
MKSIVSQGNSDTNAIDISFGTTKTPSLDTIRYNQWKATVRRHGKDLSMESSAVPLPSYIVGVGSVADWPMRSPLLFTSDVTLVCPWAGEENGLTCDTSLIGPKARRAPDAFDHAQYTYHSCYNITTGQKRC